MRIRPLTLTAVTRQDRHQALNDANSAISSAGGWLMSHTLFSNIAATLRCELPANGLLTLRDALMSAQIKLDQESLDSIASKTSDATSDIAVIVSITFLHSEPDLRQEVPAVPG
jgi:hypothetical protein